MKLDKKYEIKTTKHKQPNKMHLWAQINLRAHIKEDDTKFKRSRVKANARKEINY